MFGPYQPSVLVIIDAVHGAAAIGIVLDHGQFAFAVGLNGLGLAVKVVVVDLAEGNPVRVFLDEIDLAVKIPVGLDLDEVVVFVGFDDVRPPVSIGVDGNLVDVLARTE